MNYFEDLRPFDPATFTDDIIQCHEMCGDTFYNCSVIACDSLIQPHLRRLRTAVSESDLPKPSYWSRFLYIFTFGLLGSKTAKNQQQSIKENDNSLDPKLSQEEIDRLEQSCEENCTLFFRKCYHDCVCRVYPNDGKCLPVLYVFPQTGAPIVFDRRQSNKHNVQGSKGQNIDTNNDNYHFKWDNVN